ncbi:hypothetical protein CPB84DRAFT_1031474 [Gymnopilus junonius]|uniref:Uncharacterized protein n=1 Tax=Gymnopilus junonius TaxID=109634 RepID=A0A9P5NQF8_GYMJU|nr:hypothetical protein CPB84DRAFT_1031474 [Gymnopilus junonius]
MDVDEADVYQFGIWESEEIPLVTLGSNGDGPIIEIGRIYPPFTGPYLVESDGSPTPSVTSKIPAATTLVSIISPTVLIPSPTSLSSSQSDLPATSILPIESSETAAPHIAGTVVTEGQSSSQLTDALSTVYVSSQASDSESLRGPSSERPGIPTTSSSFLTSTVLSPSLTSATPIPSTPSSSLVNSSQTVTGSTSSPSSPSATYSASSSSSTSSFTTQSATPTIIPPHFNGKDSNLNVHGTLFYVGIIFAVIVCFALLAALIAWWVRLRSYARRREAAITLVPWDGSGKDHGGFLEAGQAPASLDNSDLSREDLAHVQAWTPCGDRDVGEPRHANCYFGVSGEFGRMSSSGTYFPAALRPGARRQLPPHLIDENAAARAMQESPLYRQNRRMSLENVGPPDSTLHSSQYMVERLRNHRKRCAEPLWEEPGHLPTPGGSERQDETSFEAWSASIKMGLANAFNAVAANLSAAPRMSEDDNLTAFPKRTTRESIRNTSGRTKGAFIRESSTSTAKSKAWTLEETGNGAGVVHILQKNGSPPSGPQIHSPTLPFADGNRIYTHDKHHLHTSTLLERTGSRIPLLASSKPQAARVAPTTLYSRQISTDSICQSNLSRGTSVYSQASLQAGRPTTRGSNESSCIPRRTEVRRFELTKSRTQGDSNEDSIVIRPDMVSEPSSTDSSIVHK